MSNEITVNISFQVRNAALSQMGFVSFPTGKQIDMKSAFNGPTPGAVTVSTQHTTIPFSQLTSMGGWCWLFNTDANNFVEYGMYDPVTNLFHGLGELLPGEFNIIRLSRYLGAELKGQTGTGTSGHGKLFALKADIAPVVVIVAAFDP